MERSKMPISERAKQFAPFASLRGYNKVLKGKEILPDERVELSEERILKLSNVANEIKKGDMIRVVYYNSDKYVETVGMVSQIDLTLRYICVIKTKIPFSDIYDIEKVEYEEIDIGK